MNIAIENNLNDLREYLQSKGHNTFDIGENEKADAIIYADNLSQPYYNVTNIGLENSIYNNAPSYYGALILNVHNKSFREIEEMLSKRIYSSLF